jgi:hypothetical protein
MAVQPDLVVIVAWKEFLMLEGLPTASLLGMEASLVLSKPR